MSVVNDFFIKFVMFFYFIGFSALSLSRDNVSCGIENGVPVTQGYGPYDYTNPSHWDKLPIVIGAHFTREVEMLIEGSTGTVYGDIDYTLRAIPNYHRALYAMSRLQIRDGGFDREKNKYYSSFCYFERAVALQPKDFVSYMLYGIHFHRVGDLKGALNKYTKSEELGNDSAEFYYNFSLLYFDIGNIDLSKYYAEMAYDLGYPLQGLKRKLKLSE